MDYSNNLPSRDSNISNYPVPANKANKILIFIIVVLLLIIFGGGGFILAKYLYSPKPASDTPSQQPAVNQPAANSFSNLNTEKVSTPSATVDETANWKTYMDSQFGFSFKYPESGSVQKNSRRDQLLIGGASFTLNYNDTKFRPQKSEIFVSVYNAGGLDVTSWLKENSTNKPFGSDIQKEFYGYVNLGESALSGFYGVRFKNEVMGFTSNNIASKKGNLIYVFGNIKVDVDLSKEFSQIISTFKFL